MATATSQIPVPSPLRMTGATGNLATEWKRFRGQWTNYSTAAKIDAEDAGRQSAIFLACIGADAYELYETFEFAEVAHRTDLTRIMAAFEAHCVGQVNVVYKRYVFYKRKQENGETFDSFLAELRKLVKTCEFGAVEDSTVRDRIRDDTTRHKLLQIRELTLAKAIDVCKASEAAGKQLKEMTNADEIQSLRTTTSNRRRARGQSRAREPRNNQKCSDKSTTRPCKYCDRVHEMCKEACPAYGKTCRRCKGKNHFESVCQSKKAVKTPTTRHDVHQLDADDDDELLTLHDNGDRWYSRLDIDSRPIRFLLDCGATANLIPETILREWDVSTIDGQQQRNCACSTAPNCRRAVSSR